MSDASPSTAPIGAWSPALEPAREGDAPPEAVAAADLAALLAARLCHDVISPASAIVSGLDLIEDPNSQDMRDDALNLIGSSARKLVALVAFARVAFGASQAAETFDTRELKTLTEGVFAHVRPNLDWALELDQLNKPAARALLNLAQIAASVLPTGGVARLEARNDGETIALTVDARGPRARLRSEVAKGLAGEKLDEGLAGHWVQAYYLYALLRAAGGRCETKVEDERVLFTAVVPA